MSKIYDAEMQYLNVSFAKDVGLNMRGGVTSFESDRISRESAGLKPLLVYSVVAPCYSVMARMLVDAATPIPISQFLSQAWSSEYQLSMPQRLEAEAALLASDQGFVNWAQSQGVACSPAASSKSLRAFARSPQNLQWSVTWPSLDNEGKPAPRLEIANRSLLNYDTFSITTSNAFRKSMDALTFDAWMARERRFIKGSWTADDWNPACMVEKPKAVPKPHLAVLRRNEEDEPLYIPGLKELVTMWPGGRRAFFHDLNVTAGDFDHWVAGRAHLPIDTPREVLAKAGAFYDSRYGEYVLGGGQLLVARTAKAVDCVYTELSHGGDLEFSFEVVSPPGEEIPMRVLVFAPYGDHTSLILFPKIDGAESLLDALDLINQTPARNAPSDVWETIKWIAKNYEKFDKPQSVAKEFGIRHGDWLSV
ncbi:MAG: hypothetical protein Q7U28_09125 [Aquabacterium sp.]|nr:hypothetical protein [Aquabacterium sp.]